MTNDSTLSRGLLGHWPGNRSPDGIVRDHSPEGNHGAYGRDARWIWFTNPRAIRYVGEREQTYLCYLGGPSGRDIVVGAYDHDRRSFSTTIVDAGFSADDHTNPSLIVRNDGRLLLFWTGHNGRQLHYAVSTDPESIASFGAHQALDQDSVTYPNPVRSPHDPDELYLFYRERTYTHDATDDKYGYVGDGTVCYRVSRDDGLTWSDQTRIVVPPEGHYSMYFVPARGENAIHFCFTDAERGGDAPKWNVMYAQFRDGEFYSAGGRHLAGPDALPMRKSDLEVVYDSSAEGNHATWIWDIAVDDGGNPIIAYATFPSTLEHEYRYARWDGERWRDYHLTNAGRYVPKRPVELHYSGGLSIDRDDPSIVYGAVSRGDQCTLKRFVTETGGETWGETTVTTHHRGDDLRPVVPRNAGNGVPVLWLTGSYEHLNTSQTVLHGLPSDLLGGGALEGDGQHGVDLGVDLYDGAAFMNGVSVTAQIEPTDVSTHQILTNFGGGITMGIGVGDEPGVTFALNGPDSETAVTWDGIAENERHHVAGVWDGTDRLALLIDGETVTDTRFEGPIELQSKRASWTLLKDEYFLGNGYRGMAEDVRLYNRPLSAREIESLVTLRE